MSNAQQTRAFIVFIPSSVNAFPNTIINAVIVSSTIIIFGTTYRHFYQSQTLTPPWTLDSKTRDLMYKLRDKLRGKKKALDWTNEQKIVFRDRKDDSRKGT